MNYTTPGDIKGGDQFWQFQVKVEGCVLKTVNKRMRCFWQQRRGVKTRAFPILRFLECKTVGKVTIIFLSLSKGGLAMATMATSLHYPNMSSTSFLRSSPRIPRIDKSSYACYYFVTVLRCREFSSRMTCSFFL